MAGESLLLKFVVGRGLLDSRNGLQAAQVLQGFVFHALDFLVLLPIVL